MHSTHFPLTIIDDTIFKILIFLFEKYKFEIEAIICFEMI